ncbi:MAG: hypothetical protein R3254_01025 [Thiomicrorhabdus sp.]|nr:hypothetical protein [Thiomicrorhabdus sp.]
MRIKDKILELCKDKEVIQYYDLRPLEDQGINWNSIKSEFRKLAEEGYYVFVRVGTYRNVLLLQKKYDNFIFSATENYKGEIR